MSKNSYKKSKKNDNSEKSHDLASDVNKFTPINININRDEPHLNDYLYLWSKFNNRPSKVIVYTNYSADLFWKSLKSKLKSGFHKNIISEVITVDGVITYNNKYFVEIDSNIYASFVEMDSNSENSLINDLVIYYNSNNLDTKSINSFLEIFNNCIVDYEESLSNNIFNIVTIGQNGLDIEPFDLPVIDEDTFDNYYTDDVIKIGKKCAKKIQKSNKGLTILYGDRGTGKTTFGMNMLSNIDKVNIFIPSSMIEHTINNPDFRNLLRRYSGQVVLFIDDCEVFFTETTYIKANIFVNNLLQLVDGLYSDVLNLHIIAVLNVGDKESIDHNLLDCNNMIDLIEFGDLDPDKANDLSKLLGKKNKYNSDVKLINVLRAKKSVSSVENIGY